MISMISYCNYVTQYNLETQQINGGKVACYLLQKEGNLGEASNYRGIALTSVAVKIYNLMLLNSISTFSYMKIALIDQIPRRYQNRFHQMDKYPATDALLWL